MEGHLENGHHVAQRSPRPEILFLFPRLGHSNIAALVTLHADVIGQPARQACGVHDVRVDASSGSTSGLPRGNMTLTGAVAILAAHSQLRQRWSSIRPHAVRHRLRTTTMA